MHERLEPDYTPLDQPFVLERLFHPRPDVSGPSRNGTDLWLTMGDGAGIHACFHPAGHSCPTLLFFHGNGEIVSDYTDLADFYVQAGINFLPVDYRGYGKSTGSPTVAAMMSDCHTILDAVLDHLKKAGYTGPLSVMGRSLGSASALELAATRKDRIHSLIIESGFAFAGPLLSLLGLPPESIGFQEEAGFRNIDKIQAWVGPLLVIHAEYDHIIPFTDGRALFEACPSEQKRFLKIEGANHNDIFARGLQPYMRAIKELLTRV